MWLVAPKITDERAGDSEEPTSLAEETKKRGAKKALVDGGYDSKDNCLASEGITSSIKTRENSSTLARGSPYRARCVRERRELGYEAWRDKYRYGERQNAEGYISAVKRSLERK